MTREFFRTAQDPVYVPDIGPNGAAAPSREIYGAMGEANIHAMLKDFYAKLAGSPIAGMFPRDLETAAYRSALFFIGLLGGPPLYSETYGPPRMRARHLPFVITEDARRVWLDCFDEVLEHPGRYNFPEEHLAGFKAFLRAFSAWMVNAAGEG